MKRSQNTFMVHAWLLCFIVLSVLGFSQVVAHSATWQVGPPLGNARDQFAGGVIDGKIFVFGGNTNSSPHQDLKSTEMLDPATGSWKYRANNNHTIWGVEELTGAVVNGRLYVFGACGINFVEEYNPATNKWTSKAPMLTQRSGATAATYNNKIYVFGSNHTDAVEAYDPANDTWETLTPMPKTLGGYAVAVVADKAYVIGGGCESEGQWATDISVYDFITDTWTTGGLKPLPNPRAFPYSSAAPVVDGKIYLIGGAEGPPEDVRRSTKFEIYDTVSDTWQTGASLPTPTMGHLSVIVNGEIYVVGGGVADDGSDKYTAAVWKYRIVNHKPTIGTLTPSSKTSTADTAQTFTATYNDADGYSDLKTVDFQVSPAGTGANAIWARYNSETNKLNLYNNAGTAFVSGSCTPGTAGTLQNSQGKILCGATTVTKTKNKIVVKWSIMPKSAFPSPTAKKIRMIARDQSNATSGWVNKGNWTIQP